MVAEVVLSLPASSRAMAAITLPAAAAGAGHFEEQLPVVAVGQHHKECREDTRLFVVIAPGGPRQPLPEVRRMVGQILPARGGV